MFQKGEYVVYGTNGVCMVEEITTLNIDSVPKDREYYVLFPKNSSGKIYVPVDKGDAKMRRVITRAEAEELLYSELGIALGIPKEQVLSYIVEAVERNGMLNG